VLLSSPLPGVVPSPPELFRQGHDAADDGAVPGQLAFVAWAVLAGLIQQGNKA
jgi:hypothetical protein